MVANGADAYDDDSSGNGVPPPGRGYRQSVKPQLASWDRAGHPSQVKLARFLAHVDAADDPAAAPLAWRPLLEQRAQPGIEPIQFALAGMNAHINHDLPLAVTGTCTALATSPSAGAHQAVSVVT